jgi:hypothetical protein
MKPTELGVVVGALVALTSALILHELRAPTLAGDPCLEVASGKELVERLRLLADDPDGSSTISLAAGQRYYILVSGEYSGEPGEDEAQGFVLEVNGVPRGLLKSTSNRYCLPYMGEALPVQLRILDRDNDYANNSGALFAEVYREWTH